MPDARGEERRAVVGLLLVSKSTTARSKTAPRSGAELIDEPRRPVRPDVQAGKHRWGVGQGGSTDSFTAAGDFSAKAQTDPSDGARVSRRY